MFFFFALSNAHDHEYFLSSFSFFISSNNLTRNINSIYTNKEFIDALLFWLSYCYSNLSIEFQPIYLRTLNIFFHSLN